jgi:predicted transcriptional regulator
MRINVKNLTYNFRPIKSNQIKTQRELKRINWKTVERIVIALYENVRMKKSVLATTCHMGYDKCRLYINWLEMMELIKKEINYDGFEEMILTEKGRTLYRTKFNIERSHNM